MESLDWLGWRLLPPPACGTGVPSSKIHNPWHFGNSEGFQLLTQPQGSVLVVISVLSGISTFGRISWQRGDDQSRRGRWEVCAFPPCLQEIMAASAGTVTLTGQGKVPTSSSLSCETLRAGLEPWLLGLEGGFSLRLWKSIPSHQNTICSLSPMQVTCL